VSDETNADSQTIPRKNPPIRQCARAEASIDHATAISMKRMPRIKDNRAAVIIYSSIDTRARERE